MHFFEECVFFLTKKRQNIFGHTEVLSLFSPVHSNDFSYIPKGPKTLKETAECNAFSVAVFKSLRFHPAIIETEQFENEVFSNGSTFKIVAY